MTPEPTEAATTAKQEFEEGKIYVDGPTVYTLTLQNGNWANIWDVTVHGQRLDWNERVRLAEEIHHKLTTYDDLLAACEAVVKATTGCGAETCSAIMIDEEAVDACRAAIAKARSSRPIDAIG